LQIFLRTPSPDRACSSRLRMAIMGKLFLMKDFAGGQQSSPAAETAWGRGNSRVSTCRRGNVEMCDISAQAIGETKRLCAGRAERLRRGLRYHASCRRWMKPSSNAPRRTNCRASTESTGSLFVQQCRHRRRRRQACSPAPVNNGESRSTSAWEAMFTWGRAFSCDELLKDDAGHIVKYQQCNGLWGVAWAGLYFFRTHRLQKPRRFAVKGLPKPSLAISSSQRGRHQMSVVDARPYRT